MKELSIEEKAAAYDEAIKKAESLYKAAEPMSGCNVIIETLFPELADSEDEAVRNFISNELACLRATCEKGSDRYEELTKAISWLEKQGEHANFLSKIQVGDKVTRNEDGMLVNLSQLNRIAKPDDKIEPKFHEGEWIIFNEHHNSVYQIGRIDNYRYYLRHYLGGTLSVHFDNELIRPWTIQDAKMGDVLYDGSNPCIFRKKNGR